MPSVPTKYRVLIIDDTESIHEDFRKVLAPAAARTSLQDLAAAVFGNTASANIAPEFVVDSALQGQEGLALVQDALASGSPYAVAFVDMRMPPGWNGLETISHLWAVDPDLQVVICTAYSDHSWATIAQRLGRSHNLLILKKPFDHIEALQLAHALATKWDVTRANRAHLAELGQTVTTRTTERDAAEARFGEAFNASPLPQAIIALQPFAVLAVNHAFEDQLGLTYRDMSNVQPETFGRGLDPFRWRALLERLTAGEPINEHPFNFRPAPGVDRHLRCSARVVQMDGRLCSIWVLRDVTQQLEVEQQLRQSQKLEAIGQLSAGVAHDFNNVLTIIQGYTSEVLAANPDAETKRLLTPVQAAAHRAAALTRQLLIFSRKQVMQPELIQLNTVFEELRPLLRRLIDADVEVQWDVAPELPPILADPATIEQVLVNLVVNARDAMPAGGRIHITAAARQVDTAGAAHRIDAKPGSYVEISVADTGTGIAPEVLPRIFEPFFTTKEAGKGTGLGLSTVYSVVKQNGGWVDVRSVVGAGTTFTVYHPVAPDTTVQNRLRHEGSARAVPIAPYQRVLVAEDDAVIQALLAVVFDRRNIKYDLAPDGVAAVALWKENPGTHDLLVTDVVMPGGVSGIQLAREVRRQRPDLPVILMSGYSTALADPRALDEIPGVRPRILMKPFLPNDLIAAMNEIAPVRRALDGTLIRTHDIPPLR